MRGNPRISDYVTYTHIENACLLVDLHLPIEKLFKRSNAQSNKTACGWKKNLVKSSLFYEVSTHMPYVQ